MDRGLASDQPAQKQGLNVGMGRQGGKNKALGMAYSVGKAPYTWRREVPWWHYRYWFGYRWRFQEYRADDSPLNYYQTDKQSARRALQEQFDPHAGVDQVGLNAAPRPRSEWTEE